MLDIKIKTIPDSEQRYNTVGDYEETPSHSLNVTVSAMSDWRFEMLTAAHEIIEGALCKQRGITNEQIDAFDLGYEAKRAEGDASEPGDSQDAPYYKEHQFANKIEKMLADELGADWERYCNEVDMLTRGSKLI